MPDDASIFNNGNNSTNSSNTTSTSSSSTSSNTETDYLKHIQETLDEILKHSKSFNQSSAKDQFNTKSEYFRSARQNAQNGTTNNSKNSKDSSKKMKGAFDRFTDSFEKELMDGLLGSDFQDKVKGAMQDFADSIGVSLEDVPDTLGKALGQQLNATFKSSKLGQDIQSKFDKWKNDSVEQFKKSYSEGVNSYWEGRSGRSQASFNADKMKSTSTPSGQSQSGGSSFFTDTMKGAVEDSGLGDAAKEAAQDSLKGGTSAGAALKGLGKAAIDAGPMLLKAAGGALALEVASEVAVKALQWSFAPAIEGVSKLFEGVGNAFQRSNKSSERNLELANERFQKDVEAMITEPFDILKDAANEVYEAWDKNVRLINGTQGYTKEDLQDLLASYSQRLRNEGLSSVVSSVDITESLAKVLESGLSGKAAEEFAYQATLLNAAIPSQDFFSYADTYASIAANAMQQGMDQASALSYANQQLDMFASNLLYSSRTLTDGFTTGLQDAQNLFQQSVQIAQAAGTNNSNAISSVMTAVAGYVGAVAPDLAQSMTDAIYKAATGGNSSEIVALRSLAGINASNTEFLRQLANNPQGIFTELFNNLGDMQKMSEDNYMEVAEGLSNIFGVSMDAFARVDFNKLANAIANMNTNTASLEENLKLLASGETTTTAEQLRMQQINEYLIDEGLAYVLDNEVARTVQQHMWDEQLARELMEAQYAVELKGDALEFLEGIRHTIDNIMTILNPFNLVGKLVDVVATAQDSNQLTADVKGMLEAGKVGQGNAKDLANLTTRNKDLNLTEDYITLLGGTSSYGSKTFIDGLNEGLDVFRYGAVSMITSAAQGLNALSQMNSSSSSSGGVAGPTSVYSWGTSIGKSVANYLASTTPSGSSVGAYAGNVSQSSTDAAKAATKGKIDRMLDEDYMNKFIEDNKTYDDWAKTAKNFGISDLSKALEDVGYSEESVKARFQSGQANYAAEKQAERYAREELFWDNTEAYLTELNEHAIEMIDLQKYANEMLDTIYAKETEFYDAWVDYFVKHTAYSAAYDHTEVSKVQSQEKGKSQDAIYALAEALTKNSVDLLDPAVQTNALLSQILVVVNAIMQQNNEAGKGTSLPDALSALAMGIVK